jgi:hypothetical protein
MDFVISCIFIFLKGSLGCMFLSFGIALFMIIIAIIANLLDRIGD